MELEDLIYEYITTMLPDRDLKRIFGQYDVENHLHEDVVEEMKTELFNTFYGMLRWKSLLNRIEDYKASHCVESEEEKSCESDNGDSEEEAEGY
jgi:hypothetical protein